MQKVSVIITVHNSEEFLEKTLKTALSQTYSNLEFIVIDNKSDDGSVSIIKHFTQLDERIHHFQISASQSIGMARNYGLQQAKGDFIYFLDSDDYLPEKTIEY